jgi:glyoxylase-like metal-dependent hydrolase (beta-lactamase superfamily II)
MISLAAGADPARRDASPALHCMGLSACGLLWTTFRSSVIRRALARHFVSMGLTILMLMHAVTALAFEEIVLSPEKVSVHVYYFRGEAGMASAANKGYMSNAGFVVTDDGVIVFDALGTPALGKAMLAAIAKITPKPVKRVIVSHYHADHYYGLQAFKARGVEIWAHENARDELRTDEVQERLAQRKVALAPWVNEDTRLIPADRWLHFDQSRTIPFESGGMHFRIIDASGAHSSSDVMLFVEEDKVLFAGDLYATGRIPFVGDADSRAWLGALDRMRDLHPAIAIPGHGTASGNTERDMQLTRDYLVFLRKQMGAAVANMTDFDQAYKAVDWTPFKDYPAFAPANRLNAYGTYLRMEQESLHE